MHNGTYSSFCAKTVRPAYQLSLHKVMLLIIGAKYLSTSTSLLYLNTRFYFLPLFKYRTVLFW